MNCPFIKLFIILTLLYEGLKVYVMATLFTLLHKWKPFTGRPAGRPKSQREDDVRNDLKKMKFMK